MAGNEGNQYLSPKVEFQHRSKGVVVSYTGLMTPANMLALQPIVTQAVKKSRCAVFRMDKSLCAFDEFPHLAKFTGQIPGAVVVTQDQWVIFTTYAAAMAELGIRRCVFLDSQLGLCRQWIDWQLEHRAVPLSVQ